MLYQFYLPKKESLNSLILFSISSTDPFMYGYEEVSDMSIKILKRLNQDNIKCTVLTKGLLPIELANLSKENEYGITLVSLNNEFKNKYEPYSANYTERIENLRQLHLKGCKTWVSIEPYPTPNIVEQDITKILDSVSFVDKVIFGRLSSVFNNDITFAVLGCINYIRVSFLIVSITNHRAWRPV